VVGSGVTKRLGGESVELSSTQVRIILHSVYHPQGPYELRVSVSHKLCNSEHPRGCKPLFTVISLGTIHSVRMDQMFDKRICRREVGKPVSWCGLFKVHDK
jgi:hypothetical protein